MQSCQSTRTFLSFQDEDRLKSKLSAVSTVKYSQTAAMSSHKVIIFPWEPCFSRFPHWNSTQKVICFFTFRTEFTCLNVKIKPLHPHFAILRRSVTNYFPFLHDFLIFGVVAAKSLAVSPVERFFQSIFPFRPTVEIAPTVQIFIFRKPSKKRKEERFAKNALQLLPCCFRFVDWNPIESSSFICEVHSFRNVL